MFLSCGKGFSGPKTVQHFRQQLEERNLERFVQSQGRSLYDDVTIAVWYRILFGKDGR